MVGTTEIQSPVKSRGLSKYLSIPVWTSEELHLRARGARNRLPSQRTRPSFKSAQSLIVLRMSLEDNTIAWSPNLTIITHREISGVYIKINRDRKTQILTEN